MASEERQVRQAAGDHTPSPLSPLPPQVWSPMEVDVSWQDGQVVAMAAGGTFTAFLTGDVVVPSQECWRMTSLHLCSGGQCVCRWSWHWEAAAQSTREAEAK